MELNISVAILTLLSFSTMLSFYTKTLFLPILKLTPPITIMTSIPNTKDIPISMYMIVKPKTSCRGRYRRSVNYSHMFMIRPESVVIMFTIFPLSYSLLERSDIFRALSNIDKLIEFEMF